MCKQDLEVLEVSLRLLSNLEKCDNIQQTYNKNRHHDEVGDILIWAVKQKKKLQYLHI